MYEQDWLDNEFDHFAPLTQSATLGRTWLRQMDAAAAANGVAIQYCMSHSRHVLASAELPAVTQARDECSSSPPRLLHALHLATLLTRAASPCL